MITRTASFIHRDHLCCSCRCECNLQFAVRMLLLRIILFNSISSGSSRQHVESKNRNAIDNTAGWISIEVRITTNSTQLTTILRITPHLLIRVMWGEAGRGGVRWKRLGLLYVIIIHYASSARSSC